MSEDTKNENPEQDLPEDRDPCPEPAAESPDAGPKLPKVDFSTFILSLASSALVQLGEVPNPETGQSGQDLPLAKHTIDIVCLLRDKIRDGMTGEEERLLEGLLYELRMKYVIKSK